MQKKPKNMNPKYHAIVEHWTYEDYTTNLELAIENH